MISNSESFQVRSGVLSKKCCLDYRWKQPLIHSSQEFQELATPAAHVHVYQEVSRKSPLPLG